MISSACPPFAREAMVLRKELVNIGLAVRLHHHRLVRHRSCDRASFGLALHPAHALLLVDRALVAAF